LNVYKYSKNINIYKNEGKWTYITN